MPLQLDGNKYVGITFGYTKAYFTVTPEHPPVNGEVFFNGTASYSSGSIVSYEWNFGDGTTGTGPTVYHTYTAAGNYIVILTVTSTVGTATYNQLIPVGVNWYEDVIPEIVVTILLFFVLPLFLLFLWNRRQPPYIIIQSTRPECVLCHGRLEGDCDGTQCKMTPC
ncbi:MAG: PKD domain-containing protein [Candidatus Bathyarchaeota archaeon]|nr:PKD domain-containing protein [Candidatus Bathyarchaeota archaeon]